jgi:hypothetical protein
MLQTIEAGAMDNGEDEGPTAARRGTQEVLSAHRTPRTNNRSRPQLRSIGVQAGSGVAESASSSAAAGTTSEAAAAAAGMRRRAKTTSSIGFLNDDAAEAAAGDSAAGGNGKANANGKASRAKAAGADTGKKVAVNAKRVEERQPSGDVDDAEVDGMLDGASAVPEAATPAVAKQKGSKAAAAGSNAAKSAAAAAGASGVSSSSINSKARRRSRMSDGGDEKATAPSQRGSEVGAVAAAAAALPEVPLLPLGAAAAHDESTDFEETPPSSSRHVRVSMN